MLTCSALKLHVLVVSFRPNSFSWFQESIVHRGSTGHLHAPHYVLPTWLPSLCRLPQKEAFQLLLVSPSASSSPVSFSCLSLPAPCDKGLVPTTHCRCASSETILPTRVSRTRGKGTEASTNRSLSAKYLVLCLLCEDIMHFPLTEKLASPFTEALAGRTLDSGSLQQPRINPPKHCPQPDSAHGLHVNLGKEYLHIGLCRRSAASFHMERAGNTKAACLKVWYRTIWDCLAGHGVQRTNCAGVQKINTSAAGVPDAGVGAIAPARLGRVLWRETNVPVS